MSKTRCKDCIRLGVCPISEVGCAFYAQKRIITQADHIRSMSDEELAEFLEKVGGCGPSFDTKYCNNVNGCPDGIKCWLDWLKQEADDAD